MHVPEKSQRLGLSHCGRPGGFMSSDSHQGVQISESPSSPALGTWQACIQLTEMLACVLQAPGHNYQYIPSPHNYLFIFLGKEFYFLSLLIALFLTGTSTMPQQRLNRPQPGKFQQGTAHWGSELGLEAGTELRTGRWHLCKRSCQRVSPIARGKASRCRFN